MVITTQFEAWLNDVNPILDSDYLALYQVIRNGVTHKSFHRTIENNIYYLKSLNNESVLKLASEKAVYVFIKILGQRAKIENFESWCRTKPTIFDDSDIPEEIIQAVIDDGIAGISGGRLAVRSLVSRVKRVAEQRDLTNISSSLTYNHDLTELAFPFDDVKFDTETARRLVVLTFEEQHL